MVHKINTHARVFGGFRRYAEASGPRMHDIVAVCLLHSCVCVSNIAWVCMYEGGVWNARSRYYLVYINRHLHGCIHQQTALVIVLHFYKIL